MLPDFRPYRFAFLIGFNPYPSPSVKKQLHTQPLLRKMFR